MAVVCRRESRVLSSVFLAAVLCPFPQSKRAQHLALALAKLQCERTPFEFGMARARATNTRACYEAIIISANDAAATCCRHQSDFETRLARSIVPIIVARGGAPRERMLSSRGSQICSRIRPAASY